MAGKFEDLHMDSAVSYVFSRCCQNDYVGAVVKEVGVPLCIVSFDIEGGKVKYQIGLDGHLYRADPNGETKLLNDCDEAALDFIRKKGITPRGDSYAYHELKSGLVREIKRNFALLSRYEEGREPHCIFVSNPEMSVSGDEPLDYVMEHCFSTLRPDNLGSLRRGEVIYVAKKVDVREPNNIEFNVFLRAVSEGDQSISIRDFKRRAGWVSKTEGPLIGYSTQFGNGLLRRDSKAYSLRDGWREHIDFLIGSYGQGIVSAPSLDGDILLEWRDSRGTLLPRI